MAPAPAEAAAKDPFVFVMNTDDRGQDGRGLAWWLLRSVSRPTGTSVAGVSLDALNAARQDPGEAWCFVDVLSRSSFASPFRDIQTQIEDSFERQAGDLFRASGPFTGDGILDAVLGNYETCEGRTGPFLLITDRTATRQILYIHAFEEYRPFMWMRLQDGGIVIASCFECGHAEGLFYDRRRRQFYWQNLGD